MRNDSLLLNSSMLLTTVAAPATIVSMAKRVPLEPAASIIAACNGATVVAGFLDLNRVTVWRWTQPPGPHGGTGGRIPAEYQSEILAWAREHGRPVTERSFFLDARGVQFATLQKRRLRLRKLRRLAA